MRSIKYLFLVFILFAACKKDGGNINQSWLNPSHEAEQLKMINESKAWFSKQNSDKKATLSLSGNHGSVAQQTNGSPGLLNW